MDKIEEVREEGLGVVWVAEVSSKGKNRGLGFDRKEKWPRKVTEKDCCIGLSGVCHFKTPSFLNTAAFCDNFGERFRNPNQACQSEDMKLFWKKCESDVFYAWNHDRHKKSQWLKWVIDANERWRNLLEVAEAFGDDKLQCVILWHSVTVWHFVTTLVWQPDHRARSSSSRMVRAATLSLLLVLVVSGERLGDVLICTG